MYRRSRRILREISKSFLYLPLNEIRNWMRSGRQVVKLNNEATKFSYDPKSYQVSLHCP